MPSGMKLEDVLMEEKEEQDEKPAIQEEVEDLQEELKHEKALKRVMKSALQGNVLLPSHESSHIPLEVQLLLTELALVEEEINLLEKKVKDLSLILYRERKQTRKVQAEQIKKQSQQKSSPRKPESPTPPPADDSEQACVWPPPNYEALNNKGKKSKERKPSSSSASEILSLNLSILRSNSKTHHRYASR